jgi:phosphatidylglycerol:prolipoprotein diacylglycerol transferase
MKISNLLYFYQHLPEHIDPIIFNWGDFSLRWYGLMYLFAFATIYLLLSWRIKKRESRYDIELLLDFLLKAIVGALLGGRLGYVFFYNLRYYFYNPLEAFLPIKLVGNEIVSTGFYGMSFYGGLLGVIFVTLFWAKKPVRLSGQGSGRKIDFWHWADFVVPAIPAGYFFGRLGNFLNGELFGRITTSHWGMYFSNGLVEPRVLRHPSQLYEAFFEGIIIFSLLWSMRNRKLQKGSLVWIYLGLYGFFRFWIEFLREPDPQLGLFFSFLTLGQIFSGIIMLVVVGVYFYYKRYENEK